MKKINFIIALLTLIGCSSIVSNKKPIKTYPYQVGVWRMLSPDFGLWTGKIGITKSSAFGINTVAGDTINITSPTDQRVTITSDSLNTANDGSQLILTYSEPFPFDTTVYKNNEEINVQANLLTTQGSINKSIAFTSAGFIWGEYSYDKNTGRYTHLSSDSLHYRVTIKYNPMATDTIPQNLTITLMDSAKTKVLQAFTVDIKDGLNQVASQITGLPSVY